MKIDKAAAQVLQDKAFKAGDLLVWTIYDHPRDFPHFVVLRPHSTRMAKALPEFLLALTVEGARNVLPHGLTCLPRAPQDDPKIVETWL